MHIVMHTVPYIKCDMDPTTVAGADWAAWHLPGGPVGPPARWAATSNVGVGKTIYPINTGRVGRGKEGSEGQSYEELGGMGME